MSESTRSVLDRARDVLGARMTKDDLRLVLENVVTYAASLENRVAELETFARGCDAEGCVLPHSSWCERAKKTAAENGGCTCGEPWKDHPQPHAAHCWVVNPPRDELEELRARVAEMEAAAEQIRHLHTDSPMGPCPVCIDADAMVRGDDYTLPYPCPTALLAGAKDCHPAPRPAADGITRLTAPSQALRDDEPAEPGACTECGDAPSTWCLGCAKCSCEPLHDRGCMYAAGGAS